jgi:hypothetical protein
MFDELTKYKHNHFFFKPEDRLMAVCNAPTDESGVYLVYALANGNIELIYIGRSGKKGPNGKIKTRLAGCGGIKDRIVNGKHFNRVARRKSWPLQMMLEKIDALDVYWYVTFDEEHQDFPEEVETFLLNKFKQLFGQRPRWNKM